MSVEMQSTLTHPFVGLLVRMVASIVFLAMIVATLVVAFTVRSNSYISPITTMELRKIII